MQRYGRHFNQNKTPQTEPLPSAETPQVQMRSGGFGWEIDDWGRLDRFLILGTEGGSYYVNERKLTKGAGEAAKRCLKADGIRVVNRVVEISQGGRAFRNDAALFVLAMASRLGNEQTKAAAHKALPAVARIGTHLFHFCQFASDLGKLGGNGFKRALARWYNERDAQKLAYQMAKYQQRDGWSHRDVLRLAHARPASGDHDSLFKWAVKGAQNGEWPVSEVPEKLRLIWAFEKAKQLDVSHPEARGRLIRLITDYRLPHECVPNEAKNHAEVWEALLQGMPPHAMVRNLNKLTAVGLLDSNMADATQKVVSVLTDAERLKKARMHPMSLLVALRTYKQGQGFKGKLTWSPVRAVVDALDESFYLAFGAVEPTNKRIMLALDVSGSMSSAIANTCLTCREASAAMALVTANVEKSYEMVAFSSGRDGRGGWATPGNTRSYFGHDGITPVAISPRMRLDDAVREVSGWPFGGTDCALPMRYALERKLKVDAFVIYTDSESWAGPIHVSQALSDYRLKMGIPAKLVVVAMTADKYSVADPNDAYQLDVVGFDTATPNVVSSFVRDED
jgi:60 kDa SS-A/Ro ribonucleoprotein